MAELTLQEINACDQESFVRAFAALFEGPPWIVRAAWSQRPFSDRAQLQQALSSIMYSASQEQQVALLRAHPDLVGRAALAGTLTPSSTREQAAAGLDRLSPEEIATFTRLNAAYQERFGFPFVICARENKKESILAGFSTRLQHTREQEITIALAEVAKICSLRLQVSGRELPFTAVSVREQESFAASDRLFSRSHGDYTWATLEFVRAETGPVIAAHRCGRLGFELFKVTGSAFTHFVRDEYTTLPERVDRPLFIALDVLWRYSDANSLVDATHTQYVAGEQVRDIVQGVFHEFVSESIQHLVHEMGLRILARFPQLAEVTFEGQNRTRDLVAASDERVKVYTDPFSAYGVIKLTISRNA